MAKSGVPLVIVESPAKARTLARFLGSKYRVEASYGHIRDLPESAAEVPAEIKGKSWGRMGVDTDGDFTPYYVVPADKKKNVTALKAAMKDASELILATDPDREGESISWHLKELLKPKVKVRRIVFHEITEEAVRAALADAHDVDENLVRAQESRRILDRLYGYTLSPVLWKKVQTGLSAGRVQSVAVRVIVEREEERLAFRAASYWDLEAKLRGGTMEFGATLAKVGGQRVATGKDFDSKGQLESNTVRLLGEKDAQSLRETLMRRLPWTVTSVEEKPFTQRPSPPFTTSTLQQEANRKLGFSSERTMQIAQRLFQGMDLGGGDLEGVISYHRTDSTTLSQKALGEAATAVKELYGAEYHHQRQYQTKVRNAQEAHEAIRPTHFHRTPASLEKILESDELKVYELIWKRAVASQMADAKMLRTSVEITGETNDGAPATFNASGKAIEFPGYLRAYVEGSDDPSAELADQDTVLPKLAVGDQVWSPDKLDKDLILLALDAKGHETSPPARYTEASLVKRLEEEGIGRPSTYAPTVATIQRRGYISRQGKALVPSFTAFAVTRLLRNHFGDYVDIGFTAEMETDPRQDLERRARLAGVPRRVLSRRQEEETSRSRAPRRGQGPVDRISDHRARPRSRKQPAGARPHRPLRSVPAARRSERRRAARVVARRSGAGRSHAREGDRAAQGQGAGTEVAWCRSGDRSARLRDARPLRRLRAARRDAGRSRREAAPRVARPRLHRRNDHAQ